MKAFGCLEEVEQQRDAPLASPGAAKHDPERDRCRSASAVCRDRAGAGDRQIWVNRLDRPQGSARIRIQASDVSLVLQPAQQTSIRNILPAQVMQCIESHGQVEVRLEISGRTLWARISPWARDELG